MNLYKIVSLERHRYAPELNKAHLEDGRTVKVPGCTTIQSALELMNQNKVPFEKPTPLIERIEKTIQDLNYETGKIIQIAEGIVKVFTIEILDGSGYPEDTMTIIVNPDGDVMNIMKIEDTVEIKS
jgi:hypothetical protein